MCYSDLASTKCQALAMQGEMKQSSCITLYFHRKKQTQKANKTAVTLTGGTI